MEWSLTRKLVPTHGMTSDEALNYPFSRKVGTANLAASGPPSQEARFCIPNRHRRVIMQMMGATWRRRRTEVKATYYDSNTPLEELVAIRPIPHGLTSQTWKVLCNYWKSTESQENGRKSSRIKIQQLS